MSKYLLAVHMSDEAPSEPMSEEDMRRGFAKIEGIEQELKAANALRFTGAAFWNQSGRALCVPSATGSR